MKIDQHGRLIAPTNQPGPIDLGEGPLEDEGEDRSPNKESI